MKTYFIKLLSALLILPVISFAQGVAINEDDSNADPSAVLDIDSSDKGFLMPRMTTAEIASIVDPANGLLVYCTDDEKFYAYISSENTWKELGFAPPPWACGDPFTDARDGQTYSTVQIGTQCWMQENLNYGTMINGSNYQTDNGTIEKYCYNNNTTICDEYGGLYQWNEMMEYVTTEGAQGICPEGWHVPSDSEWMTLEEEAESTTGINWNSVGWRGTDAGLNLRATYGWNSGGNGTDLYGYRALPGGYRDLNGSFVNPIGETHFCSSSEDGPNAWSRALIYSNTQVRRLNNSKVFGFSVRCLKD